MPPEENGRITRTKLGFYDHGILTTMIGLRFEDTGQGFGGWAMDSGDFMRWYISEVLRVTGADEWEDLVGRYVRARRDPLHYNGWAGRIVALGCIDNDPLKATVTGEWFDPSAWKKAHPVSPGAQ